MATVRVDAGEIRDWDSFHDVFQRQLGFPGFYGRNMNAWIDCMSSLDDPHGGLASIVLAPDETLVLEMTGTAAFAEHLTELLREIVVCTAFVNNRYASAGSACRVAIVFLD